MLYTYQENKMLLTQACFHNQYFDWSLFQAPASPPQNLTVTPIDSRSVHLSWSPPPREHHNGIIRQFWINITEADTGRKTQMTSLGTSLSVPSLHPFYIYWFSVAAYTVDLGPFTEPLMLQMPQDGTNKMNSDTTTLHSYINICFINSSQLSSKQLHCSCPLITFNPSDMGCPTS